MHLRFSVYILALNFCDDDELMMIHHHHQFIDDDDVGSHIQIHALVLQLLCYSVPHELYVCYIITNSVIIDFIFTAFALNIAQLIKV